MGIVNVKKINEQGDDVVNDREERERNAAGSFSFELVNESIIEGLFSRRAGRGRRAL